MVIPHLHKIGNATIHFTPSKVNFPRAATSAFPKSCFEGCKTVQTVNGSIGFCTVHTARKPDEVGSRKRGRELCADAAFIAR